MKAAHKTKKAGVKAKPRRSTPAAKRSTPAAKQKVVASVRVPSPTKKRTKAPVAHKKAEKPASRSKAKPASTVAAKAAMAMELSRKKAFRSRAALSGCSRRKLIAFAEGRMELDEKLDTLYHLDHCQKCWDDLYLIRKSKNGRLYSRKTRSYSEADIKALEKESTPVEETEEDDSLTETESAFDVA